jgi:hypothetical protein
MDFNQAVNAVEPLAAERSDLGKVLDRAKKRKDDIAVWMPSMTSRC